MELGNLVVRWREQDIDDEFEDKCAIKYFWCDFLEKARVHVIVIEMSEFFWLQVLLLPLSAQFNQEIDINTMLPNNPIILNSPQTQPQSETERIKKLVSKNTIKGLSIVQLICAGIAIITHITLLSNQKSLRSDYIAEAGAGLWTGFFFGVSGFTGLFASHNPSKCKYDIMLFSCISIIFRLTVIKGN